MKKKKNNSDLVMRKSIHKKTEIIKEGSGKKHETNVIVGRSIINISSSWRRTTTAASHYVLFFLCVLYHKRRHFIYANLRAVKKDRKEIRFRMKWSARNWNKLCCFLISVSAVYNGSNYTQTTTSEQNTINTQLQESKN